MLSHHHLQTKHFLSHRRCRHKTQVKENTIDLNWERWRFAAEHLVMRGYHFLSHTRQDWRKSEHSVKKQATKEGTVVVGSLNRWEFPWQYEAISTFKTYSWFPRHNATTILSLIFLLVKQPEKIKKFSHFFVDKNIILCWDSFTHLHTCFSIMQI